MPDREFFDRFAAAMRAPEEIAPSINGDDPAKAKAAIAVYRNNVRVGLSKALKEKFPAVERLVGPDFFKFAARKYFNAHPPISRLLADYGDQFPAFLETFKPAQSTPYLADVARLEIAWLEAYRAADVEPLSAEQISAASEGEPSRLALSFHPSLRLLPSAYPVVSIWRRCKEESGGVKFSSNARERAMIVRPRRNVVVRTLTPGAYAAMIALSRGDAVEKAFNAALAADPDFDPMAAFQILFDSGVVVAAEPAIEE